MQVSTPSAENQGAFLASVTFGDATEPLHKLGYKPIPTNGKAPVGKGWTRFAAKQDAAEVRELARRYPGHNVGLVTGDETALDVDVYDAAAAKELALLAEKKLGAAPVRVGQPPKLLLLYRTDEPFEKITSRRFTRGDGRHHRVEFLGRGQQFIGFGLHPDTGQPYRWGPRSPINTPAADLTAITERQVREFVTEAETLLLQLGFQPVDQTQAAGSKTTTTVVTSLDTGEPAAVFANRSARVTYKEAVNVDDIDAAIACYPSTPADHDWWRDNIMFPIADASRRAPEHEDRLWAIFDRECRRTADPAKASDEYFARAEKELNHAIANPRGDGRSISYMRVIRNALDLYGWNPAANNNVVGLTTVVEKTAQSTGAASHTTRPFSSPLGPFDTANIHRPPSIASGLLRRGQITLLAASAGGAKTVFTITLLVALAAGRRQFGAFRIEGQRPGGLKVLYVSAEEEPNSVRLLVGAACQVLALNAAQRALVAQNFDIHDAAESGWLIGPSRPGQDIVPDEHDPAFQQLACLTDRDVVVLDTVAALVAVGNENDNVAVTARMRRLGKAARIGDFALLALHHTPKLTREAAAALRGEAPLVRGGGAFVASARCVLTLTSLPDAEAAQFIVQGFQADRVRRLEHAKLNDGPFMTPAYLALRSELVKVNDGTDVSVRAVEWISAPTGSGSASNALRDLVMRAIDKGATDTQGARVPLSPGGGHKNERDAIEYVGRALMHAEPTLNETQSKRLARDTIRDLQQLGCVVVDEVSVPRYKADGQRDGSRKVKGLVCRWERALWAANKVESQAAATGLSGGENA